jgi:hypothetical protein
MGKSTSHNSVGTMATLPTAAMLIGEPTILSLDSVGTPGPRRRHAEANCSRVPLSSTWAIFSGLQFSSFTAGISFLGVSGEQALIKAATGAARVRRAGRLVIMSIPFVYQLQTGLAT